MNSCTCISSRVPFTRGYMKGGDPAQQSWDCPLHGLEARRWREGLRREHAATKKGPGCLAIGLLGIFLWLATCVVIIVLVGLYH